MVKKTNQTYVLQILTIIFFTIVNFEIYGYLKHTYFFLS
jgi:hypothetical protein